MGHLFDFVAGIEAIESRVPRGRVLVQLLLSLTVLYAILRVLRALALDFFLPAARFTFHVGSLGTLPPLPSGVALIRAALPWLLAAGALLLSLVAVRRIQSRMYTQLQTLESTIGKYQSLFWKPPTADRESELRRRLAPLGRSKLVRIYRHENTDCGTLAYRLSELFAKIGWTVVGPTVGTWEAVGVSGIVVGSKGTQDSAVIVAEALRDCLVAGVTLRPVEPTDQCDIVVGIGPKPPQEENLMRAKINVHRDDGTTASQSS
jgi:hypothetical protein